MENEPSSDGFAGRLTHKENLGSEAFLHIALNDGATPCIVRVSPEEAHDVSVGETLSIGRTLGKALVFGPDGRRLPLQESSKREQVA